MDRLPDSISPEGLIIYILILDKTEIKQRIVVNQLIYDILGFLTIGLVTSDETTPFEISKNLGYVTIPYST